MYKEQRNKSTENKEIKESCNQAFQAARADRVRSEELSSFRNSCDI